MLTVLLIRRFNKIADTSIKTCPHCKKLVDPNNEDTEYIGSKVNEQFFHRSCFVRAYRKDIKNGKYGK